MKPNVTTLAMSFAALSSAASAEPIKLVSWNMGPELFESAKKRSGDMRALNAALAPDVIVLIEVAGMNEVRFLADSLGWDVWYAAVSDGLTLTSQASFALETAVISKIPIEQVIEYDARPEGNWHSVMTSMAPDGDSTIPVSEMELSSHGISGINPMAHTDRGTIRVDLEGGLTIFPVHLKSNFNAVCGDARRAGDLLEDLGLPPLPELAAIQTSGNEATAEEDALNAIKRERVIAAIKTVADMAVPARTVIIAGDYNTSFEEGKVGASFQDCALQPCSCTPAPFPAAACTGDGYDDSFAILTAPLVGTEPWDVLTGELGRTYDDTAFADKAIDHISVPSSQAAHFGSVGKADDTFGSDHFPVFVTYSEP